MGRVVLKLVVLAAFLLQAAPVRNCALSALALGVSCHDEHDAAALESAAMHCDDSRASLPGDEPPCRMCDDKDPVERPVKMTMPAVAAIAVAFQLNLTLQPKPFPPVITPLVSSPPLSCSLPLLI